MDNLQIDSEWRVKAVAIAETWDKGKRVFLYEVRCPRCMRHHTTIFPDDDPTCKEPCQYGKQPIPQNLRYEILERDGYKCQRCGATDNLEVDHIYPERRGGATHPINLQTLCQHCNRAKGARYE